MISASTLKVVGLLFISNMFMTTAWYGHLRFKAWPIWLAIIASWGIAGFEYLFQVPANRLGYGVLSAYQLKIMQEAITLVVFTAFSWVALDERPTLRHAASFGLIFAAVAIGYKK